MAVRKSSYEHIPIEIAPRRRLDAVREGYAVRLKQYELGSNNDSVDTSQATASHAAVQQSERNPIEHRILWFRVSWGTDCWCIDMICQAE